MIAAFFLIQDEFKELQRLLLEFFLGSGEIDPALEGLRVQILGTVIQ